MATKAKAVEAVEEKGIVEDLLFGVKVKNEVEDLARSVVHLENSLAKLAKFIRGIREQVDEVCDSVEL